MSVTVPSKVRLHVNVDHVATLRQARGTAYPDPVEAAVLCEHAGADGITVHLREDRRHIQDRDVDTLRRTVKTLLNLERAATDEMIAIAGRIGPDKVTLVPERREEQTTEGGLDVVGHRDHVRKAVTQLKAANIRVSLFIDPEPDQVKASLDVGAAEVELHTGDFAEAFVRGGGELEREVGRLVAASECAQRDASALAVAAGHGLTVRNVPLLLSRLPQVAELNIGHAMVSDAVFFGLPEVVRRYRAAIDGVARR
jgi:pyridoxine 5-phosphate synthase